MAQQALIPGQQQIQQQQITSGQQELQSGALKLQQQQKDIADQQKIEQLFAGAGDDLGSVIPKAMAINPQMAASLQKTILESQTAGLTQKKAVLDYHSAQTKRLAELAGSVNDQQSYQSAIGQLLNEGTIDAGNAAQLLSKPYDPATVQQFKNQALTAQEQIAQANKTLEDQETHRHNLADEGVAQAATLQLPGGQKVPGKKSKQGDLLLADNTPAPKGTILYQQPNYGQLVLPSKTQTVLVNGIPTIMGYNEKTQQYDIPQGTSATGAYGHEMAQAGAVTRAGTDLITDIQANKDKLGNLSAWVQKYGLNTPIADPTLAKLQAELSAFAALQPAMHGFRGGNALETFNNLIGDLQKNPDATIASIQGILKTAGAINPEGQQGGSTSQPKTAGSDPFSQFGGQKR